MDIRNNKGITILIVTYLIILILLILGVAFFYRSFGEMKIAERQKYSVQAVSIAEAGIERAFYELRQDYINDATDPSWADGDINGVACGPDSENFYLFLGPISLGNGQYIIELKNVGVGGDDDEDEEEEDEGDDDGEMEVDEIWVKATGTVGDISKIVQTYVKMENFSPWNNAIFAGTGAEGSIINGNVDIRGPVHILGDGLGEGDFAIDLNGSGNIGNNYEGIPSDLEDRIPDCPTTIFNGKTVDSLSATVRIKNGLAGLSGTATFGDPDDPDNSIKETVDGVFITDGYGGTHGEENVYSDNGTQNGYDLGDSIPFPSLSDPYQGYPSYQAYLMANALVISDPDELDEIDDIRPDSNFEYTDGTNTISMDGNGNLTINGIVYINGGSLNMNKQDSDKTITYTGEGSILVTETVGINVNLLTSGDDSFPTNILGIMTPNQITFDAANINVMGIFYAEDRITALKQTSIAGTIVSNYFNIGNQVPSIYQVPDVFDNLPEGMIGSDPIWIIRVISWQEL